MHLLQLLSILLSNLLCDIVLEPPAWCSVLGAWCLHPENSCLIRVYHLVQIEVPLTTSKVEETLKGIEGRKEYYLKKRLSVKDGTYDAETDPEAQGKKKSAPANGVASTSNGPAANGDVCEDFEHVRMATLRLFCNVAALGIGLLACNGDLVVKQATLSSTH